MSQDPAVLNVGVLNHFVLNYAPADLDRVRDTRIRIMIDGVLSTARVRLDTFSIHNVADDEPDACSFSVDVAPWPEVGQDVRVSINSNAPRHQFNGAIQTINVTFEGRDDDDGPRQVVHASAADDLAAMDRIPMGVWTNLSATTVAQQLLAAFAPGFTGAHIAAGLPAISITLEGSEGWGGALREIAGLIGGAFYVEDRDLHLFLEEWTDAPDPITVDDRFAYDPAVAQSLDDSQLRTRIVARGHGEKVTSDVLAGETILPVDNAPAWFSVSGGKALTDDMQRLDYGSVQVGGAGAVVGPSAAPSAAPTLDGGIGGSITPGAHQWAYVWGTATGKSLPSPVAARTVGATVPTPTVAPTVVNDFSHILNTDPIYGYGIHIGDSIAYAYSYGVVRPTQANVAQLTGNTAISPSQAITILQYTGTYAYMPSIRVPYSADPNVAWINFWHNINGTGWKMVYSLDGGGYIGCANVPAQAGLSTGSGYGNFSMGGEPGTPPPTPNATISAVSVAGIALGPTGTTYREVYRTIAGGAQLKLLTTIANNTSTGPFVDTLADGSLGASAPSTDTSGLTTVSGQVNAGSPTLLVASAAPFYAAGGWTMNGIRYSGISGNTLTGIPPTGPGAILTTLPYGTAIIAAPTLTGVTGLARPLTRGSTIFVFVQRDDLSAQAEAAARETSAVRTSDGIHEYMVSDAQRTAASLTALCDAYLALFARPLVTVTYATRDMKTKAGKMIVVDLAVPAIQQTLMIQDVAISEVDVAPGTPPKYTVTASSIRYSLEGMLRRLSGLLEA